MPSEVLTVGRAGVDILPLQTGVGLAEGSSGAEAGRRYSGLRTLPLKPDGAPALSTASEALISSADGGTFAPPSARTERSSLSARYGPKENVPVESSGAGASSRQVDNHCLPGTVGTLGKIVTVVDANPYGRQRHRLVHHLR